MSRTVTVSSAAMPTLRGEPALEFHSMQGHEGVFELFRYTVTLTTPDNPMLLESEIANVDFKALVGIEFSVKIELDGRGYFVAGSKGTSGLGSVGKGYREINGLVTSARFVQSEDRRGIYQIVMEPWITLLGRTTDYKIFQNQTPLEIVRSVLKDYNYLSLEQVTGTYEKLDYQVQYGESDLAFITRIMAEFGFYYYFTHKDSFHELVIANGASGHGPNPSAAYQTLLYARPDSKIDCEYIDQFTTSRNLQSGQWVTQDFDFRKPNYHWNTSVPMPRKTGNAKEEVFHWPGDHLNTNKDTADMEAQSKLAQNLARVRMEGAGAAGAQAHGAGNLRGVVPGHTFRLEAHPNDKSNIDYLVTRATLDLRETGNASGAGQTRGAGDAWHCRTEFTLQPANDIYRPEAPRDAWGNILKPRTHGPQTAIVTGPPGKEIWTDMYGRVKLSFHWNRYCTKDHASSCWVRVSSVWAGNGFGGIQIPRVGQEVVVDFENGDPDRPIVTGRVYNAMNLPPWSLPANQTQSGLLTRSTEQGGPANANALRFEDKKGKEEVWLHAEKDQRIEVENDESHWVGHDRSKTIDHDETNHIKNDRTETVDGHEKITVHKTRTETVDGDETLTVHSNRTRTVDGNETESVGKVKTETIGLAHMQNVGLGKMVNVGAAYNINVGGLMATVVGASHSVNVGMNASTTVGKKLTLEAGEEIELKVGESVLVMKADGTITLNGIRFEMHAPDKVTILSQDIDLN